MYEQFQSMRKMGPLDQVMNHLLIMNANLLTEIYILEDR
jgi:signal recognition particle GTPase